MPCSNRQEDSRNAQDTDQTDQGECTHDDHQVSDELRFVQLTPPGSACSIVLGTGITQAPAGSSPGVQVVVDDAEAARAELSAKGVEVSPVDEQPWGHFVHFTDPDGNPWSLQAIPASMRG